MISQARKGKRNSIQTEFKPGQIHVNPHYGQDNAMSKVENRLKVSAARKGKKWFHNPMTGKVICVYPSIVPYGFVAGKKILAVAG